MAPRLGPLMALFIRQCVLWMAMTVLWSASVSFAFFLSFFSCCSGSVTGVVLCGDRTADTAVSQWMVDRLLIGVHSVAGVFIKCLIACCFTDMHHTTCWMICLHCAFIHKISDIMAESDWKLHHQKCRICFAILNYCKVYWITTSSEAGQSLNHFITQF